MADIQETRIYQLIGALAWYNRGIIRRVELGRAIRAGCSGLRNAYQSDELVANRTNMPDLSGTGGAKIPLSPVIDEIRQTDDKFIRPGI